MTPSPVELKAALTRLRNHFGETATAELLAAAWTVAYSWPSYSGARPDATRRHPVTVALEAKASAAWIRARTERDTYVRPQVLARSHHPQDPLDDVLTLVGNGDAALEATLDQAVAELERLRSVVRGEPAPDERNDNRPRRRALN